LLPTFHKLSIYHSKSLSKILPVKNATVDKKILPSKKIIKGNITGRYLGSNPVADDNSTIITKTFYIERKECLVA